MYSRRDVLVMMAAAAAAPRMALASNQPLQRQIPGTDESLPVLGLGT